MAALAMCASGAELAAMERWYVLAYRAFSVLIRLSRRAGGEIALCARGVVRAPFPDPPPCGLQ